MKPTEEIKCGMECIRTNASRICIKPKNGQCPRCEQLVSESLGRIQQLESQLAQVKKERDAAVDDLEKYKGCGTCKFQDVQFECDDYQSCAECDNADCPCYGISVDDCWQWRGVCDDDTEDKK